MKFLRVGPPGQERPVLLTPGGTALDLRPVTADIDSAFLARVASGDLAFGDLPPTSIEGERVGPPIARPGIVACIGLNYRAHAAESGAQPPEHPVLFYKPAHTVVGPYDEILLPPGSQATDWEAELAVVIGRQARYLSTVDEAWACIAGYTISNDVSERDYQLKVSGGQWSKGKSCETFNPLGPWLVTPDELDIEAGLRVRSRVNGEPRQDSTTADMIFGVAQIIYDLSQYTVLQPGDVVNTGTPEGVALSGRFPYLGGGDVVEIEIEGLGGQRSEVRKWA